MGHSATRYLTPARPVPFARQTAAAFSLLELLAVIGILAIIALFALPAFTGIKGGTDAAKAIYDLSGLLEKARAYAVTQNTYVWVGAAEVDASLSPDAVPQRTGTGRIAFSAVASKDGTKIYDETQEIESDWNAKVEGRLTQIEKLMRLENMLLSDALDLARPTVAAASRLANTSCESVLAFTYPLSSGSAQYTFQKKVIQFDPQGRAQIVRSNGASTGQWIEIALQARTNSANVAAVHLHGLTGAVRIFRP